MKGLFAFLLLALSAAPAQAERWILKNPNALVAAGALRSFEFGGDRYAVVEAPRFSAMAADLNQVAESAVPDLRITLPATVSDDSDSLNRRAWHVDQLQYKDLPSQRDGNGVIVAVLDTGVDYTHQALKDRMWTNQREVAGNGVDDDGNGYIDDIHGFDFESDDSDPRDGDSHGTHCAGVIASGVDADSGAQGVAPNARVMAVRIIGYEQKGFLSDAVAGIKYAVDNGAKVLSNSWRVYRSWHNYDPSDENIELLRRAIEYAGEHGAIFVAAAGNETRNLDADGADPMFPGGYTGLSNLVVVAASDQSGQPASFTNYGSNHVTVAAPGRDIISTIPGDRWQSMSGTSMATPLVAGAIARGMTDISASLDAVERLVTTSRPASSWTTKVRAGGVVHLVDYLK